MTAPTRTRPDNAYRTRTGPAPQKPNGRGTRSQFKLRNLSNRLHSNDYQVRTDALEESARLHEAAVAARGWGQYRSPHRSTAETPTAAEV